MWSENPSLFVVKCWLTRGGNCHNSRQRPTQVGNSSNPGLVHGTWDQRWGWIIYYMPHSQRRNRASSKETGRYCLVDTAFCVSIQTLAIQKNSKHKPYSGAWFNYQGNQDWMENNCNLRNPTTGTLLYTTCLIRQGCAECLPKIRYFTDADSPLVLTKLQCEMRDAFSCDWLMSKLPSAE